MKENIKKAITKQIGLFDGPGLIATLEKLGVGDDIEMTPTYLSIPTELIKDPEGLQKELGLISKIGRDFKMSPDKGRTRIDLLAHSYNPQSRSDEEDNLDFHKLILEAVKQKLQIPKEAKQSLVLSTKASTQFAASKGSIHGIWLTQAGGTLHKAIKPNLSSWLAAAAASNFQVVLWTNTAELQENERLDLERQGVLVKDCRLCDSSRFYPYFSFFLEKGIQGDKVAFALASDVLRMAILDLTPETEYFIYADPNDVWLPNLKDNLSKLNENMSMNSLGFSFYVNPIFGRKDLYHLRNDILIALKQVNPNFFKAYLNAYQRHLEENYKKYFKAKTDGEAQQLAMQITMSTGDPYFQIYVRTEEVSAKFGPFKESRTTVHAENFIDHKRMEQNGNSWLPQGNLQEETDFLEKQGYIPPAFQKSPKLSFFNPDRARDPYISRLLKEAKPNDVDALLSELLKEFREPAKKRNGKNQTKASSKRGIFGNLVQEDYFPNYPMAKPGEKKAVVQDPNTATTFYMRIDPMILLRVIEYGRPDVQYEALYFDVSKKLSCVRGQDLENELPIFKHALEEFFKNKNQTAALTASL